MNALRGVLILVKAMTLIIKDTWLIRANYQFWKKSANKSSADNDDPGKHVTGKL